MPLQLVVRISRWALGYKLRRNNNLYDFEPRSKFKRGAVPRSRRSHADLTAVWSVELSDVIRNGFTTAYNAGKSFRIEYDGPRMLPLQYFPLLGTRIASVTYDEAVSTILDRVAQGHAYVCAANVHSVSMARRSAEFRNVLNSSLLTVPDGKPLIWAHRVLGGRRLTERVYGPTLMLKLCEAAAARGLPIYLYGGKEGVVEHLATTLTARYPGLRVAGTYSPPFGDRAADDPALLRELDAINASGCKLVFVSLGAPKQELFMHRHASRLDAVQIGVGAAFDFHSGRVAQAPEWMQDSGLEWLFRFCAEPRRLWRRYLFYNPYFIVRVMLQRMGLDGPSRELAKVLATGSQS